jgi:hypothetical protein
MCLAHGFGSGRSLEEGGVWRAQNIVAHPVITLTAIVVVRRG